MRNALELHRPALLVSAVCVGLALSIWVSVPLAAAVALALCALGGLLMLDGVARLVALGVALAALGLGWGSLRMDALRSSVLVGEVGETGAAELVTVAPARSSEWSTRVIAVTRAFRHEAIRERVLLVLPVGRSPPRGAILEASVRIAEPRPEQDGFDERAWLARQGIRVVLEASSWREVGRRGGLAGFGDVLRDRIERAVTRGADGTRRGIVLGVVLGEDEGLPADVQDDFRASGLYHLLAVSGQNVAFLAGGIYALGWLLRLSRRVRELSILVTIAAYVLAVGWQPSVVRAGVAGALASLAWLSARPTDRWHFLALGAFVLMAWMPTSLLEPGFQLSFVAVAAIFVAVPRVRQRLDGYPVPTVVADAVSVALACGVVTAPIVLFHFGEAPLYTVLANVVAFVAAPLVLGLGLLAAVVDPVSPGAAAGLAALAGWAAAWLELVARVVADLPRAQVDTRTLATVAAIGATMWLVARRLRRLPRAGGLLVSARARWSRRRHVDRVAHRTRTDDMGPTSGASRDVPRRRSGRRRSARDTSCPRSRRSGPTGRSCCGAARRHGRSVALGPRAHPPAARPRGRGGRTSCARLDVGQVLDPDLEATGPEREEAIRARPS